MIYLPFHDLLYLSDQETIINNSHTVDGLIKNSCYTSIKQWFISLVIRVTQMTQRREMLNVIRVIVFFQ